jgi:hypothetical protein
MPTKNDRVVRVGRELHKAATFGLLFPVAFGEPHSAIALGAVQAAYFVCKYCGKAYNAIVHGCAAGRGMC